MLNTVEVNKLFATVKINEKGIRDISDIRDIFHDLLMGLEYRVDANSREFSIVKTKLEEACMYAVKSCCLKNKID